MPFGFGQNKCIGGNFALIQIEFLIKTLIKLYRFLPAESKNDVVEYTPLVRFTEKLFLKFEKRI